MSSATKLKRDYWSAKMRVACEPLAMRPITKLTPEHSGRATKPARPIRLSICESSVRPPFNLAGWLAGLRQKRGRLEHLEHRDSLSHLAT
jgi:hypothetical protein